MYQLCKKEKKKIKYSYKHLCKDYGSAKRLEKAYIMP